MSMEDIAKIASHAPPIWRAQPELGFLQVESTLQAAEILIDAIKFQCVVFTALDLKCQRSKVQGHVRAPAGDYDLPQDIYCFIHIDIVGLLPPSKGYSFCLTYIDMYTRLPEAFPMTNQTAETVLKRTTAYHLASSGMIERWHRQLKSLKVSGNGKWVEAEPQQFSLGIDVASKRI
ncbi:transposon Tf2-6 polyprotein [Trichonephila clavata]|uniref:Transposon Tf2-6 polyprotein n=1 Tax=Trichonephila clavata TaxID=2740835 RepID=A0A8X6H1F7_TRICU|nr:transposon Tf2-6 polyprotein [Trichonephila clavata]